MPIDRNPLWAENRASEHLDDGFNRWEANSRLTFRMIQHMLYLLQTPVI
jgi:hypothetical protein